MIIEIHGRKCLQYPVHGLEGFACGDCGDKARHAMIEIEHTPSCLKENIFGYKAAWFWCGQCDIGG